MKNSYFIDDDKLLNLLGIEVVNIKIKKRQFLSKLPLPQAYNLRDYLTSHHTGV